MRVRCEGVVCVLWGAKKRPGWMYLKQWYNGRKRELSIVRTSVEDQTWKGWLWLNRLAGGKANAKGSASAETHLWPQCIVFNTHRHAHTCAPTQTLTYTHTHTSKKPHLCAVGMNESDDDEAEEQDRGRCRWADAEWVGKRRWRRTREKIGKKKAKASDWYDERRNACHRAIAMKLAEWAKLCTKQIYKRQRKTRQSVTQVCTLIPSSLQSPPSLRPVSHPRPVCRWPLPPA